MAKITLILLSGLFWVNAFAQQDTLVRAGLLRAYSTLSPGFFMRSSYDDSPYYLHGNLEYYLDRKISLVGESYFDLEAIKKEKWNSNALSFFPSYSPIEFSFSTFLGANFHKAGKKGDLFAGLQPGISLIKLNPLWHSDGIARMGINPLISASLGYNYYFFPFFHFFIQSRYIFGRHLQGYILNLNELRFSAGLGLNLNSRKAN